MLGNQNCSSFRMLLAFHFIPMLQKHLDTFKDTTWNTHGIQKQAEAFLPDRVTNHIFEISREI